MKGEYTMQIPPISHVHSQFDMGDSDDATIGKRIIHFEESVHHFIGLFSQRTPPHLSPKEVTNFMKELESFHTFLHDHSKEIQSLCKKAGGDTLDLHAGLSWIDNLSSEWHTNRSTIMHDLTEGENDSFFDGCSEGINLLSRAITHHL